MQEKPFWFCSFRFFLQQTFWNTLYNAHMESCINGPVLKFKHVLSSRLWCKCITCLAVMSVIILFATVISSLLLRKWGYLFKNRGGGGLFQFFHPPLLKCHIFTFPEHIFNLLSDKISGRADFLSAGGFWWILKTPKNWNAPYGHNFFLVTIFWAVRTDH